MFVYGVGIQYGPQFFASLRGPGLKYMALATVGGDRVARRGVLVLRPLGVSLATAAGLFAGSGTSTPTLQAAWRRRATRTRRSATRWPIPSAWSVRSS